MNAEIITIGDEILLGQIVDTNSAWIGQQLNALKIKVNYITSISDREQAILDNLKLASSRSQFVLVTGGLGPTKDDVTKQTIAKFFESKLVRDENVLIHVKNLFARSSRKGEMPKSNYAQADVLEKADVLFNDVGTAPGMWIPHQDTIFVFLPGVPFEMKYLIENRVLPKIKPYLGISQLYHSHIITVGIGESYLAEQIADIESLLPSHMKLAYLPKLGLVRLRLSAEGNSKVALQKETESWADKIADRLIDYVVSREDVTLEKAIVDQFTQSGLKLATAESCAGGGIASTITSVSGASVIFDCGIVAYHNAIKQQLLGVETEVLNQYGAVSEQTVIQMAEGVKRLAKSDYAIATSGIAGPTGGTEDKPVGLVWVAVAGKNVTTTKKFQFHNDRQINIERTITQALIMLWNLYRKESSSL